jgi:hypothetical protein
MKPLFLPLKGDEKELINTLFYLTKNSVEKFNTEITKFAKITSDSINEKLLKKLGYKVKSRIFYFGDYLINNFQNINETSISEYVDWLFMIQSLRTTSGSHRQGGEYHRILEKYKLEGLTYQQIFHKVLNISHHSLLIIAETFEIKL